MGNAMPLLLALVFVIGTSNLVSAQAPAAPPAGMQNRDKTAGPSKYVDGTVKSAGADRVVVAGKEQGREAERTFAIDAATTLKKGGQKITAADLKPGDAVQVRYLEADGKARAEAITVQAPAKAKPRNPCAAVK